MPTTVLHFLYTSLPTVAGYTVRSSCILRAQRALGVEAVACTLPEFPSGPESEVLEGVTYHRWSSEAMGSGWGWVRRIPGYRNRYRAEHEALHYADIARRVGASVLHAHSPGRCALVAARVADRLGLPLVYEVRGLWDESAIAEGKLIKGSLEHERRLYAERKAIAAADRIVTISEPLRDHMVDMGAMREQTIVVPNGVDAEQFRPWEGDNALRRDPRFSPGPVIGYVGSLRKLEGLDLAVRAMQRLREAVPEVRLAIVGDGPEREPLARLAQEVGVAERVHLVGPVPHAEVRLWYDLLDLFIVPRRDEAVTHLVPPLKPLEAMACARAVLLSDVGGMRELVEGGGRGYRFRTGDAEDFVEKVRAALADPEGRRRAGEEARRWVERERTWAAVSAAYLPMYAGLVASPPARTKSRHRRLVPSRAPTRWFAVWSLVVGAAVLALSRIPGHSADAVVQGLLLSQAIAYLVTQLASRRALEGKLFRAVADATFDVGFCVSLLALAAWVHPAPIYFGGTRVSRLVLTVTSVGAFTLFSASQVGFFLLGAKETVLFWSASRAILCFGAAVLSRIRIDTWPLVFVALFSTAAWIAHAAFLWWKAAPRAPSAPTGDPATRAAKPRDNIVDKFVYRTLSRRISFPLARTGIAPNWVTLMSLLFGVVSLWSYSHHGLPWRWSGAFFLQVSFLFDCVDGEVARIEGRVSAFGAWLDWMTDRSVTFMAVLGLALGALTEHTTALLWATTLFVVACEVFPRAYRDVTSFVGVLARSAALGTRGGWLRAFERWRERHGVGMSFGTGALVLVVGIGTLLPWRLETLVCLMVVRGSALLYKLTAMVAELE